MYFFRKQPAAVAIRRLVAIAVLSVSLASCSESKLVQCTKVMAVVNKGNALIDAQKQNNDVIATQRLAQQLKNTATELQSLKLSDTKLQDLQNRLVKSLRNLSQALADIGKAVEVGNKIETSLTGREQLNQAKAKLAIAAQTANQLAESQDALADELTNYCKSNQ